MDKGQSVCDLGSARIGVSFKPLEWMKQGREGDHQQSRATQSRNGQRREHAV